ncbi:MAG: pilus assembly protein [Verrucomicrobiaceae bacterium]|nr:pilus assembly protein [Verrucomicrobiaceae bacterium]
MKSSIRKQGKIRQLGQGMTEYIIIVALVAVAGISTYKLFGQTIRSQLASLGQEVAGQTNTALTQSKSSSTSAATDAHQDKGMGAYNTGNQ